LNTTLNSHTLFQAGQDSSIWKLLVNPQGILAGEERNTLTRETSLFAYDLTGRHLLWSGVALEDKWWLSLIEITGKSLIIQHYAEGPLPTPSGVSSIDLLAGTVRWTLPLVAYFAEASGEAILLQQGMLQEQYLAVDRITGEMTRRMSIADLPPRNPNEFSHLTFAHAIDPQELGSSEVQRLLEDLVSLDDLRGSIEYLDQSDFRILSFYSRDTKNAQAMLENKLVQDIAIVDAADGQLLFRERLSNAANYPVQGSYFIFNDQLLYVKDGSELKSITLV
jgi:hypothetical protein